MWMMSGSKSSVPPERNSSKAILSPISPVANAKNPLFRLAVNAKIEATKTKIKKVEQIVIVLLLVKLATILL